jgi:hypothetical protein
VQGDTWTCTDKGMMGGKKVKTRVTIKELSHRVQLQDGNAGTGREVGADDGEQELEGAVVSRSATH